MIDSGMLELEFNLARAARLDAQAAFDDLERLLDVLRRPLCSLPPRNWIRPPDCSVALAA